MRQPRPLSTHLALFAAGIGVPLLLLALLVGWGSVGEGRARIDREAERLVGGIVGDVERELAALTATAQTLATANALVREIHDRMPAILRPEDYDRWLGEEPDPAELLAPFPAEPMVIWPVSPRVNSPRFDEPGLLDPIGDH